MMYCPVTETPVHEIYWPHSGGNRIFLKRDDLQPFSFGGNKVRIGWAFLQDMRKNGADAMLLYGDRRSNLCRVLAAMCGIEQIPCRMIATSGSGTESVSFNETLTGMFDVPVIYCEKNGIADEVDRQMEAFKSRGRTPYYIYGSRLGTGNEGTAAEAYAEAVPEILSWEKQHDLTFDRIFVPCGTGATAGGIAAGLSGAGVRREVTALSISSRSRERQEQALRDAVYACLEKRGSSVSDTDVQLPECITEYNGGGYGLADASVMEVTERMLLLNAVPLTPIYSGKAFAGMLRYIEERGIRGQNLLFLHTGGLPLFFDGLRDNKLCAK